LIASGWPLTTEEVERDAKQFLADNFLTHLAG